MIDVKWWCPFIDWWDWSRISILPVLYVFFLLRIHWMLSTILKISNKSSVWSNVFWYVKVCIFWKCIQYNIHWGKKTNLCQIKFPLDKVRGTKNILCFLSQAPSHHSFAFNFRFLYEVKHKVRLSKTVYGIFPINSVSFLLRFIFLFNKMHRLFDFKTW